MGELNSQFSTLTAHENQQDSLASAMKLPWMLRKALRLVSDLQARLLAPL